jgi:AcrR family transcriptional regulator
MTRERAEDYEAKKQLILERAAALFAGQGFEHTTIMEVAQACNASKSHVYHYFPAKEDVLFAIVREHTVMLLNGLSAIVALPLPAEERFEKFIAEFVARAAGSRDEQLVLVNEMKHLPAPRRDEIRVMETELVNLLAQLLEEINPGLMKQRRVRGPYALLIFGMLIWTFTWYDKAGTISPRELAARISQLFMTGFKSPEAESLGASVKPAR